MTSSTECFNNMKDKFIKNWQNYLLIQSIFLMNCLLPMKSKYTYFMAQFTFQMSSFLHYMTRHMALNFCFRFERHLALNTLVGLFLMVNSSTMRFQITERFELHATIRAPRNVFFCFRVEASLAHVSVWWQRITGRFHCATNDQVGRVKHSRADATRSWRH